MPSSLLDQLPLLTLLLLFAGIVKLSALLLRRMQLAWRHSLVFALAVVGIGLALRWVIVLSGLSIHVAAGVLVALGSYIAFGTWYLQQRARTAGGEAVGWRGAALLSTTACGLLALLAVGGVMLLARGR